MITQAILTAIQAPFNAVVSRMPVIGPNLPTVNYAPVSNFFYSITYFFPLTTVAFMVSFIVGIMIATITINLIVFIKSFIPFMGGS